MSVRIKFTIDYDLKKDCDSLLSMFEVAKQLKNNEIILRRLETKHAPVKRNNKKYTVKRMINSK